MIRLDPETRGNRLCPGRFTTNALSFSNGVGMKPAGSGLQTAVGCACFDGRAPDRSRFRWYRPALQDITPERDERDPFTRQSLC